MNRYSASLWCTVRILLWPPRVFGALWGRDGELKSVVGFILNNLAAVTGLSSGCS